MEKIIRREQADELAKELNEFTVKSLAENEEHSVWSTAGRSLLDFPAEVLVNIFSHVANPKFNKNPNLAFRHYLSSRDEKDFERKKSFPNQHPKKASIEKRDKEYSMRNLISLRRVCTAFEEIIYNGMMPGTDYEPISVDLKFKAIENSPHAVQMYKFGGTGAIYPCVRLKKITKFNEDDDFEHLQKFEKIRNLTFVDIPITRDVIQTILRMDLKSAEKIEFLSIPDVKLGEDVNVVEYMEQFMSTIDAPLAKIFFNSNEFDPNLILFGAAAEAIPGPEQIPMLIQMDNVGLEFNLELDLGLIREAFEGEQRQIPEEERRRRAEENERRREIRILERDINKKRHQEMRRGQRPGPRKHVSEWRGLRTINVIHNILLSEPHQPDKEHPYNKKEGRLYWKKQLGLVLVKKIEKKPREIKKTAHWHFNKVFVLMGRQPMKIGVLMDHLKVLKKIVSTEPLSFNDEQSILQFSQDMRRQTHSMHEFNFIKMLPAKRRRLYTHSYGTKNAKNAKIEAPGAENAENNN